MHRDDVRRNVSCRVGCSVPMASKRSGAPATQAPKPTSASHRSPSIVTRRAMWVSGMSGASGGTHPEHAPDQPLHRETQCAEHPLEKAVLLEAVAAASAVDQFRLEGAVD